MPIYEYKCNKCSKSLEIMQGINEKPLKKCKECGGKLEKIMSDTSFVLKGSGWYKTDYAKKESSSSKKSASKDSSTDKKDKPACASCPSNSSCS